ncbi:zinc transporter, ZIP family [Entomortierella parvispora]|uniref:Zinc transporter, ZIP family n=1 Tax=Entomortierella parvispora TaxID=205924 RepID=A0A9P3H249_9FUNG|nr:zinc transporter, ZIP family [Entomortierella parvispora]
MSFTKDGAGDDYQAWVFTLASALACVFGAGLIFIDTIVKKIFGRDVHILQNHKFLAGSLGLGSGVMIFSSFYNLLPEAKEQLSSELSIFSGHADAYLMLFFFSGVGIMALIHWIMHRFESGSNSPGIENSGAIEQFMQREARQNGSVLPQHQSSYQQPLPCQQGPPPLYGQRVPKGSALSGAGTAMTASTSSSAHACEGCVQEESDEEGGVDEEERYNDSEYVDDEVTSLLDNAFLQIGKTPTNGRMDEATRIRQNGRDQESEDDEGSIEVVISDQKDKILRRTSDHHSDYDLDLDLNHQEDLPDKQPGRGDFGSRKSSWSSIATRPQRPFAPVSKRRKSGTGSKSKAKVPRKAKECHLGHTTDRKHRQYHHHPSNTHAHTHTHTHTPPPTNTTSKNYGAVPSLNSRPYSVLPPPTPYQNATHLRRTSFPRLNQRPGHGVSYSSHDNLDHAVADDREHADLTEIGIQTALTIAVHKFPEGLITFLSTTADPCLGLSVFMAIAVHNLIEGYLIAFPLFIGLHSRTKAFALAAALGGLSQPIGAVLGWFILRKVASMGWQVSATGCIYAVVAGMMSSIAVNGMWPQAVKCVGRKKTKVVQLSFFAGIAIMGACQAVMGTQCDF